MMVYFDSVVDRTTCSWLNFSFLRIWLLKLQKTKHLYSFLRPIFFLIVEISHSLIWVLQAGWKQLYKGSKETPPPEGLSCFSDILSDASAIFSVWHVPMHNAPSTRGPFFESVKSSSWCHLWRCKLQIVHIELACLELNMPMCLCIDGWAELLTKMWIMAILRIEEKENIDQRLPSVLCFWASHLRTHIKD